MLNILSAYYIGAIFFIGVIFDFLTPTLGGNNVNIMGLLIKDIFLVLIIAITLYNNRRNALIDIYILILFFLLIISTLLSPIVFEFIPTILSFRNYLFYSSCIYVGYHYYKFFNKFDNINFYLLIVTINFILILLQYFGLYTNFYRDFIGGNDPIWVHGGQISRIEFSLIASLILMRMLSLLKNGNQSIKINIIIFLILLSIYLCQSRMVLVVASLVLVEYLFSTKRLFLLSIIVIILSIIFVYSEMSHRIFSNPINLRDSRFVNIYPFAVSLIGENFLFGYGIASFGPATIYSQFIPKDPLHFVDSTILTSLLQFGVLGTVIYLTPLIYLIYFSFNNKRIRYGVGCLVFILVTFGMFYNAIDGWPGGVIYFTLIGFLLRASITHCQACPT